jgi:hypothetical protein
MRQAVLKAKGRTLQTLDGYMLVHVPDSAAPGDVLKAKTPSGTTWAFKVPENLPQDRIIKLHMPDLKVLRCCSSSYIHYMLYIVCVSVCACVCVCSCGCGRGRGAC